MHLLGSDFLKKELRSKEKPHDRKKEKRENSLNFLTKISWIKEKEKIMKIDNK